MHLSLLLNQFEAGSVVAAAVAGDRGTFDCPATPRAPADPASVENALVVRYLAAATSLFGCCGPRSTRGRESLCGVDVGRYFNSKSKFIVEWGCIGCSNRDNYFQRDKTRQN